MREEETPLGLVKLWPKLIPGCYNLMDKFASFKDSEPDFCWPDYCPIPIGAAYTVINQSEHGGKEVAGLFCAELTACYAWRKNKVIYKFDEQVEDTLVAQSEDMSGSDILPMEVLLHLPYPCIYVKRNLDYADGFFAWIEWDTNTHKLELRMQYLMSDMEHTVALVLHLLPQKTIEDCIWDTFLETKKYAKEPIPIPDGIKNQETILESIQLLLYICSDHPDIVNDKIVTTRGRERREDRLKNVSTKSVGIHIGATLRKQYGSSRSSKESIGTGAKKATHLRRGHWHHYWVGAHGTPERKLILKWNHPAIINKDNGEPNISIVPIKR